MTPLSRQNSPDPADLAAARADLAAACKGDKAAIKRLLALSRQTALQQETSPRPQPQKDADQTSDMSSFSLLDFHPSRERRLKRLERMGAHVNLASEKSTTRILTAVLSIVLALIFAPLALLIVALDLLFIGVMTMLSLTFLVIWLAVIHKIFVLVGHS